MARGVNKVILIGNIGQDPEFRVTPGGTSICNATLATSESWKDKNTGQQVEKTEWHKVVFFNRLAEIVRDYVKKGSKIYVEGSLRTTKWQDKEGKDRYTTEVVGGEMQILDSAPAKPANSAPQQRSPAQPPSTPAPAQGGTFDDFDDDIPF